MPHDTMGQWQCCSKTRLESAPRDKENMRDNAATEDQSTYRRPLGSESAGDSGHSSGDEASCGVTGCKGGNNGDLEAQPRNSHSSESSGKYSLRDSIESTGDYDRPPVLPAGRVDECTMDLPVFAEENEEVFEMLPSFNSPRTLRERREAFHFFHDHHQARSRKISRGSRGSSSSDRGSFSSVSSVTAILKARLGRSSSLVSQYDQAEDETQSTCSAVVVSDGQRPQRTVSLRLPKSHRKPHDSDTNLPTIYVDDSPQQNNGKRSSRKSSLRRALSLLSMNSLMKQEVVSSSGGSPQAKPQKPVQKILRQPRRRHNTVRGLSGLAIDISNQNTRNPSLHRSHTVYYPTATSLRYAGTARRTHSTAS